jgi:hypothetical protein
LGWSAVPSVTTRSAANWSPPDHRALRRGSAASTMRARPTSISASRSAPLHRWSVSSPRVTGLHATRQWPIIPAAGSAVLMGRDRYRVAARPCRRWPPILHDAVAAKCRLGESRSFSSEKIRRALGRGQVWRTVEQRPSRADEGSRRTCGGFRWSIWIKSTCRIWHPCRRAPHRLR